MFVNNILQCIGKTPMVNLGLFGLPHVFAKARALARRAGLLVGTSSGANVWAASRVSHKPGGERRVVTVLPDRAERYFSTSLI